MTTLHAYIESDSAQELIDIAADMAWGALKAWNQARDQIPGYVAADIRETTDDVLREWVGERHREADAAIIDAIRARTGDVDDIALELAKAVIEKQGAAGAEIYLDN